MDHLRGDSHRPQRSDSGRGIRPSLLPFVLLPSLDHPSFESPLVDVPSTSPSSCDLSSTVFPLTPGVLPSLPFPLPTPGFLPSSPRTDPNTVPLRPSKLSVRKINKNRSCTYEVKLRCTLLRHLLLTPQSRNRESRRSRNPIPLLHGIRPCPWTVVRPETGKEETERQ